MENDSFIFYMQVPNLSQLDLFKRHIFYEFYYRN